MNIPINKISSIWRFSSPCISSLTAPLTSLKFPNIFSTWREHLSSFTVLSTIFPLTLILNPTWINKNSVTMHFTVLKVTHILLIRPDISSRSLHFIILKRAIISRPRLHHQNTTSMLNSTLNCLSMIAPTQWYIIHCLKIINTFLQYCICFLILKLLHVLILCMSSIIIIIIITNWLHFLFLFLNSLMPYIYLFI